MHRSGIYRIRHDSHSYIGSSADIPRRWRVHRHRLTRGNHHSTYLQHAWNRYGAENFIFEVLEWCSPNDLMWREQCYLNHFRPEYNISTVVGHSTLGCKASPETRAKLSVIAKSRRMSAETRAKIAAKMKGNTHLTGHRRTFTDEHRNRISIALRGHVVTPEMRERLRYQRSEETRRKMSEAAKNRAIREGRKLRNASR